VVVELASYAHGAAVEVDIFWTESGEFGPAEASECGQQDQRAVAQADSMG
jgi:hypothetical protein